MQSRAVDPGSALSANLTTRRAFIGAGLLLVASGGQTLSSHAKPVEPLPDLFDPIATPASLLLDRGCLDRLRDGRPSGSVAARLLKAAFEQARLLLDEPPVTRVVRGHRLLAVSREALRRITNLALVARLTEDALFLRRAEAEIQAVLGFEDWNPRHFLDVGEMSAAVAFGLNWLWPMLSEDRRETWMAGLHRHGPSVARAQIDAGHAKWLTTTNNVGQVCGAGIVLAALASWAHDSTQSRSLVRDVLTALPGRSMAQYAPDGAFPEGYSYWHYGTMFALLLSEGLHGAFGKDFGLLDQPGFRRSADYVNATTAPSLNGFAYSDFFGELPMEAMCWFAGRGQQPQAWFLGERWMKRYLAERAHRSRFLAFTTIWALDLPRREIPEPPLSWRGGGVTPVATHRSDWSLPTAIWIGTKGGRADTPHGHADIGSFEFEASGVRWAIDLGAQRYHGLEAAGLKVFESRPGGDRWRVFRLGPWAHNILLLDEREPPVDAHGEIIGHEQGETPGTRLDLSPLYTGLATRVERFVGLGPGRASGLIVDRLEGLAVGTGIRWAMTTRADIETTPAGATLRQDGRRLRVAVEGTSPCSIESLDISGPPKRWDEPNPGIQQLLVHANAPADGTFELRIALLPGD